MKRTTFDLLVVPLITLLTGIIMTFGIVLVGRMPWALSDTLPIAFTICINIAIGLCLGFIYFCFFVRPAVKVYQYLILAALGSFLGMVLVYTLYLTGPDIYFWLTSVL